MSKYPDPIITKTAIIFHLHEPLYGSVFSIYEKWLRIAKDRHLMLIVNTPLGKATYPSYKEWVIGAKRIEKIHNIPTVPMIMYARSVEKDIKLREKRKKIEKKIELSSNTVMNAWARLQKKDPKAIEKLKLKLGIYTH